MRYPVMNNPPSAPELLLPMILHTPAIQLLRLVTPLLLAVKLQVLLQDQGEPSSGAEGGGGGVVRVREGGEGERRVGFFLVANRANVSGVDLLKSQQGNASSKERASEETSGQRINIQHVFLVCMFFAFFFFCEQGGQLFVVLTFSKVKRKRQSRSGPWATRGSWALWGALARSGALCAALRHSAPHCATLRRSVPLWGRFGAALGPLWGRLGPLGAARGHCGRSAGFWWGCLGVLWACL